MNTLCRAFVFLPNHLRDTSEWARTERTVFFEASPRITRGTRHEQLARLLSIAWDAPLLAMQEDGVIYNLATERELIEEWGHMSAGDLRLLEIGRGGTDGIGERQYHFARAADVDLFVTPRTAQRLRHALAAVERFYADAINARNVATAQ